MPRVATNRKAPNSALRGRSWFTVRASHPDLLIAAARKVEPTFFFFLSRETTSRESHGDSKGPADETRVMATARWQFFGIHRGPVETTKWF
jgi:hypothetical protein